MKVIENMKQGSLEWHEYRRLHIGASDSSVILELNPWTTPLELWEEKVLGFEKEINSKMKLGSEMEEEARTCYEIFTGLKVIPMVLESDSCSFLSASMDGITDDLKNAVEIKCGKSSHTLAKNNIIPPYYLCQLQHQMMITGLNEMDYFSYSKKDQYLIKVLRDNDFIEKMLEKELEFWDTIQNFKPPLSKI